MSESDLIAQILLAYSRGDTRLFRFNSGVAWQGKAIEHTPERLVLLHPRPVKLAPEGFSDIAGWTSVDGKAIFTVIEGKFGTTRTTDDQLRFLELVRRHGGHAGIARSVEDAGLIIQGV